MGYPQVHRQPTNIQIAYMHMGYPYTYWTAMCIWANYLYGTEHTAKKTVKYSIKAVSKLIMDIIILLEHYNNHHATSYCK